MYKIITVILFLAIASTARAQLEYTLTTSPANITSAKALIDLPGLSGNTNAVIIATPLGNTKTINPHPTGAWYYSGKWNIFNSDYAVMIPGLTYKVHYFLNAGTDHFVHLVTPQTLGAEGSYIDNPALNNKPNIQFAIFQNHSPDTRPGSWLNPHEAKSGYSNSAGKWYITNINGQPLQKGCAYNIVINTGGTDLPPNPGDTTGSGTCSCPAALPPNGTAAGDLTGSYPDPTVKKIAGFPVSTTTPQVGQVLKWNGIEWIPADDDSGNVSQSPTAKPSVLSFTQSDNVELNDPNVNTAAIGGLNNQVFTLSQNSRIVFHTVIRPQIYGVNPFIPAHATGIQLIVEILNASNQVVAKSTSDGWLTLEVPQNMNSTGFGILPAGIYHTRVIINRQQGGERLQIIRYNATQNAQIIIEIFPD